MLALSAPLPRQQQRRVVQAVLGASGCGRGGEARDCIEHLNECNQFARRLLRGRRPLRRRRRRGHESSLICWKVEWSLYVVYQSNVVVSPVCLCFLCLWFVPRLIYICMVRYVSNHTALI